MFKLFFWFFLSIIVYTYFLYPGIIFLIGLFFSKPVFKKEIFPKVSLIMSVYNEEFVIGRKIANSLSLDYPEDKLEIIIGSDCSNDGTNASIEKYLSGRVSLKKYETRRGKVNVLNDLMNAAKGEIIVFTDARQMFEKIAVKELVKNFADKTVGCVSGELVLLNEKNNSAAEGVGLYWKYEKFIRDKESQIGSMLGATGAIYAIRKELYSPPSLDTLLDDVYIPFKIIERGYRAVFEPDAVAYDNIVDDPKKEFRRKVRTLAGNWQLFLTFSNLFNPFRSEISFQLISHKLFRVLVPFFLIAIFTINLFILNGSAVYKTLFMLQSAFYLLALIGFTMNKRIKGFFQIPYTFVVLNFAAVAGLYLFCSNKQSVIWKK
jgi:poly-beta-1,6-N-acetyl-D-glucosamine synthase